MQPVTVIRPLAEIAGMTGLLLTYIWGWGDASRGGFILCIILYVGIGLAAHFRAKESPADIGLRMDNFRAAARDALLATMLIGLILLGAGGALGSLDFPPLSRWPRYLGDGIIWGFLQQYGLLCLYYRRFSELLPRYKSGPLWATGAVFAAFHLPNPFLTIATFGAGALSCWLYRRTPNLIVLGAMHGIISFLIVETLPDRITMGMRVGPGFLHFIPGQ